MLIFVIGTRAQLVKMAPVISVAKRDCMQFKVLVTAQHRDSMFDLAQDLGISDVFPNADLRTEKSSISALLNWFPKALFSTWRQLVDQRRVSRNAMVVVHGDTASTLIGAFAARLARLRVAHVESGLTSHALFNPFPEELIRRLVVRLADVVFCPDEPTSERMRKLGGPFVVNTQGNTIADSLDLVLGHLEESPVQSATLVSIHRFENVMRRARLKSIVSDLIRLARCRTVYFVLHPPTQKRLHAEDLFRLLDEAPGMKLLPRMPYSQFMRLASDVETVVTDGGSNQEELSLLGVPAIILRSRTERKDGLGQSCVLESEIPGSWVDFIISGASNGLRRARVSRNQGATPSELVVATLRSKLMLKRDTL